MKRNYPPSADDYHPEWVLVWGTLAIIVWSMVIFLAWVL